MRKIAKKNEPKDIVKKKRINQCKKGKAVERELVHLLKDSGIEDAERSEQHEGKGGVSDVKAKSLWMFHIECKGEKNPTLVPSTLKRWLEQVERDCPADRIPILFHKANNTPWVALCYPSFTSMLCNFKLCYSVHPVTDTSFNPSELLNKARFETSLRERAGRNESGDHIPGDLIKFNCLITDYDNKLLYVMYGATAGKLIKKISDYWNTKISPSECIVSETVPQSSEPFL